MMMMMMITVHYRSQATDFESEFSCVLTVVLHCHVGTVRERQQQTHFAAIIPGKHR